MPRPTAHARLRALRRHLTTSCTHCAGAADAEYREQPPFFTAQDAGFALGAPPDPDFASPYAVTPAQRESWLRDGVSAGPRLCPS